LAKKWIQKIKMKKGSTKEYLYNKYGKRAFTKKGTIKNEYLNRAIKSAKDERIKKRLNLAKTLKKIRRWKKRRIY